MVGIDEALQLGSKAGRLPVAFVFVAFCITVVACNGHPRCALHGYTRCMFVRCLVFLATDSLLFLFCVFTFHALLGQLNVSYLLACCFPSMGLLTR